MEDLSRAAVIAAIRAALKTRSAIKWSVRGGTGTAWGWLHIDCPPAHKHQSREDAKEHSDELARLLGLEPHMTYGGASVPDSYDFYREFLDRAAGRTPSVTAQPYWD